MIKTGVDIIEVERFKNIKNEDEFLKRIFTIRESKYIRSGENVVERLAGHFAAKEAFAKFLGTGIRGFSWHDIEICHEETGKPYIMFMGNRQSVDLSISHSKTVACAVVAGEDEGVTIKEYEFLKAYRALLPRRKQNMHKGDCGHVLIIAGSKGMTGATCLSASAAMRTGCGLVTVAVPESEQPIVATKLTEAMTIPLQKEISAAREQVATALQKCDVCVFGPGMGRGKDVAELLEVVLKQSKTVVLDADGINALGEHIDMLKEKNCPVILTPHLGEMSRLTGKSIEKIKDSREDTASEFAKTYGVTLLLKGHETAVASEEGGVHINNSGNSGMASGGMGDVLSGVIAALVAQGAKPYNAAVLGAFLHGLAGDIAAQKVGEYSLIASDVIDGLPKAICMLRPDIHKK